MDEPDFPDFGSAYPTMATTPNTESASWNPALRGDAPALQPTETTSSTEDDFFDRYPGATPKKAQATVGSEDDISSPISNSIRDGRRQSIAVEHVIDVRKDDATPEQLRARPETSVQIEGPWVGKEHETDEEAGGALDDDEEQLFGPSETLEQQHRELDAHAPVGESVQDLGDNVQEADHAAMPRGNEEDSVRPQEHYEHQGDATEMEEALDESVNAPLMEDEQALPTVDSVAAPHEAPYSTQAAPPPPIERSFTTNFTNPPKQEQEVESATPQQSNVSDQWPAAGDDRTFGELLGSDSGAPSQIKSASKAATDPLGENWPTGDDETFGELLDGQDSSTAKHVLHNIASQESAETSAPDAPQEEDLSAVWQAALDDDDLLDENNDLDPSKFFGEDDDDFLDDEEPLQLEEQVLQQSHTAPDQYRPANQQSTQRNVYAPAATQNSNQAHGRSAGTPDTGLFDLYNQGTVSTQQSRQEALRPQVQHAQSFADKSKGGYQSPYDLPMDVIKPRRRPAQGTQQQASGFQRPPAPPPRTSSFQSQPPTPSLPPQQQGVLSPPTSSHSSLPSASTRPLSNGTQSAKSTPRTDGGFFADLPVTAKPRTRPSGAYTPQPTTGPVITGSGPAPRVGPVGPPQAAQAYNPTQPPRRQVAPAAMPQQSATYNGLRQPERMPLLPDVPSASSTEHLPGGTPPLTLQASPSTQPVQRSSRFSPAPPSASQPAAATRYSPAPGAQQQRQSSPYAPKREPSLGSVSNAHTAHPFAPRTSSPLAHQIEKPHPPLPAEAARDLTASPPRINGSQYPTSAGLSPERMLTARYSPSTADVPSSVQPITTYAPPARAKTQSPSQAMKQPRVAAAQQLMEARPNSAAGMPSYSALPQTPAQSQQARLPRRRQFSQDLTFVKPNDERADDPLERWRGRPIFTWNAAGSVVLSFPKQTPFYAAGHGVPSIKCTPGPVSVQDASEVLPMDERDIKFPGPLPTKSKGKKKDVLAWLNASVEKLDRTMEAAMLDFSLPTDLKKRAEEKAVLWKLMRIFVEHDGSLEGNPKIEEEVRRVLLPNLAQMNQVADLQSPVSATGVQAEVVDIQVLLQLRQALLEGQRERAVWVAEEKKLWGHAMLIASTLGPDTWRQIIQAFVRSQVKTAGGEARSLAALYQIFAGNSEDCVDELVPPSARAGFQMVSKTDGSVAGNPLEGLDQWRETLGLVVSNRTPTDQASLVALGTLLSGYGRVEAACCCFLFARQIAKHSGADDAEANFVLLGGISQTAADAESVGNDLDAVLLTETYEWAASLAPTTNATYLPHLQAYKLVHAQNLAAYGFKTKAQQYCDHITTAYTSTTRPSQYYHPTFTSAVADLSAFLSKTPQDGKGGGLFSKPAMNKVSSGAASWFTKFVSGEDEAASKASTGGQGPNGVDDAGPFGRVSGEISRTASSTELYNPMMMGGAVQVPGSSAGPSSSFAPTSAPSRYAPSPFGQQIIPQSGAGKYAPLQTSKSYSPGYASSQGLQDGNGRVIPSLDQESRPSSSRSASSRYAPAPAGLGVGVPSSLGVPRPEVGRASSDYGVPYGSAPASRRGSAQDPGSQGSYEPHVYTQQPVQAQGASADDVPPETNDISNIVEHDSPPDAEANGYSGYEPPTTYQPYEPEPDSPEDAPKLKKGIMDDDDKDDAAMIARAAALKKSQADRAADEAFRKAAEADAERDKAKGGDEKKAGWFGGWFGGKPGGKDGDLSANKPIRAKLGEESSFVYDETLKKWVNKKGGAEVATPAAATPPPPRGPPSRVASGFSGAPPSGPPSRVASGAALALNAGPPGSGPPSRAGTPASSSAPDSRDGPPMPLGVNGGDARPASGPPSRPPTSMSTASSLDDLLGGPPGVGNRKAGGTVKGKKKGGRYVDVMAK